jgi:hypothetical protein
MNQPTQPATPLRGLLRTQLANTTWFARLGDGISFNSPVLVDRTGLVHANVTPDHNTSSIDGHDFLTWRYDDHTATSQSPAKAHCWELQRVTAPAALLQRCCEALELPGTPRDFHHILGMTYRPLHRYGAAHTDAVMTLCHADIALIERYPSIIEFGTNYDRVDAYRILIAIYEGQGQRDDAREIRACAIGAHQRVT